MYGADPTLIFTTAAAGLTAIAILSLTALKAWNGWLDLRRQQISGHAIANDEAVPGTIGARIELADLKERIRRLEAIAAGVDL
ncbi:hypothetical protein FHS96_000991 [Sphingomonas zeicaulis]|uniref:hypothetical protein n=1 Tax=Sphingomonas zeicaulis TaxID=1632740 RepID=UPI003D23FD59